MIMIRQYIQALQRFGTTALTKTVMDSLTMTKMAMGLIVLLMVVRIVLIQTPVQSVTMMVMVSVVVQMIVTTATVRSIPLPQRFGTMEAIKIVMDSVIMTKMAMVQIQTYTVEMIATTQIYLWAPFNTTSTVTVS